MVIYGVRDRRAEADRAEFVIRDAAQPRSAADDWRGESLRCALRRVAANPHHAGTAERECPRCAALSAVEEAADVALVTQRDPNRAAYILNLRDAALAARAWIGAHISSPASRGGHHGAR